MMSCLFVLLVIARLTAVTLCLETELSMYDVLSTGHSRGEHLPTTDDSDTGNKLIDIRMPGIQVTKVRRLSSSTRIGAGCPPVSHRPNFISFSHILPDLLLSTHSTTNLLSTASVDEKTMPLK